MSEPAADAPAPPLDPRALRYLRLQLINPGALISRRDVAAELLELIDPALAEMLRIGRERDVIPYVDAMIAVPATQGEMTP